jgi:hypothetical protein
MQTAHTKRQRKARENDRTAVRMFVLDYLRDGPIHRDNLCRLGWRDYGFTAEEITKAATFYKVTITTLDGEEYATMPTNLYAIWWAKDRWHQNHGGPAAV